MMRLDAVAYKREIQELALQVKSARGLDPGFDFRWRSHPKPQATVEAMFRRWTGLPPEAFAGKTVLDAGCGCGRYLRLLADAGADVTGVDSSPRALEAAGANCPDARLVAVDLLEDFHTLGEFDHVLSLGVLHHTADPSRAFANCARAVKAGGELTVWVYEPNPPDVMLPMEMLHEITKACPPEALYRVIRKYALPMRQHYAGAWGALEHVLRVSNAVDDEECISDTFDWHCPQYRSAHEPAEVEGWFEGAGLAVTWRGEVHPVGMRGKR